MVCISCKEYVDAATHKYFIQVAKSPEEEQTKKKNKKKKEEVRSECWSGNVGSKWWSYARRHKRRRTQTPLHVFFHIEGTLDTSRHVANLTAETEHDDRPEHFKDEDCITHFLEWLDMLTKHDTWLSSHTISMGMMGILVWKNIINNNARSNKSVMAESCCKWLMTVFDSDSLSFFQMLLASFPKTPSL